jgi:hypothetical protein
MAKNKGKGRAEPHFSEDWDGGHDHEQHNQLQGTRPSTTTVLEDKKNLYAYL